MNIRRRNLILAVALGLMALVLYVLTLLNMLGRAPGD
jgi:hypothetical protein